MIIFAGGKVRTVHSGILEAVAIDGDRIAAAGTLEEVRSSVGLCEEIDLKGCCIAPGFTDSHCHLQHTGVQSKRLNMRGARSAAEMIERGRAYIRENAIPEGTWIMSDGYDHNLFDIKEMPTREIADAITDKHPLLLERICGHVGTLNTRGLEAMGFTEQTKIEGGSLDIGPDGQLNGILRENALYEVTFSRPKATDPNDIADLLAAGMRKMNSYGVTGVHSDDLEGITIDLLDEAIDILRKSGRMTVRLFEELLTPDDAALQSFIDHGCKTGKGDEYYKYGNIKLILDGSLGAQTAYMTSPYPDSEDLGFNVYTAEQIAGFIDKANAAGLQTACHAIGDAAAEQCISAVERAVANHPTTLRHRVVHGQFLRDDQIERMAKAGMGADIQPAFLASDWQPAESLMTDRQRAIGYRWKSLIDAGIPAGGGSDSPVEECDPIWGMYCAVTRRDAESKPERGWHPEQCLTQQQAFELYTTNPSILSFEEGFKGDIIPGMAADLVILSDDPCSCAPEGIRSIRVIETIMGGKTVYKCN